MPILDRNALEFVSRGPEQTRRLGAHLGALLQGGDTICMQGPVGSGKTCLAQGVGRGWGVGQTLISPTYVLIREYERPRSGVGLYHIDLYRIDSADEAFSLGLEEVLGDSRAICVIEWAERAQSLIPSAHLWIRLDTKGITHRGLRFQAHGKRHSRLLRDFRRVAFGI